MCEAKIKIADRSDLKAINNFLASNFHDKEPIETSHVDRTDKMIPDDEFILSCISSETTLMTLFGDELVGVLLAGKILPNEAERNIECAKHIKSKKSADILKFLSYIEEKADYCHRLKVPYSLHIHIICVHPQHQGLGLAKNLFKSSVEHGRNKNYPAVSIDCTNSYTAKIAESIGMRCLSMVTYQEYNEYIGAETFIPTEPHTEIRSYAKLYEN